MSKLKPPLTFEYQVQKLKSKGFDIKDEAGVLDFLKTLNYYQFSAYLFPFYTNTNVYEINISIEKPIAMYNFDFEMRNILFAAVQKIEIEVKTSIAYFFSHKYWALGYYNKNNFNRYHKTEIYEEKIRDILNKHKKSLVIKHHYNNYNGKIPFFAIIDFFTFSQVSIFYWNKTICKYICDLVYKYKNEIDLNHMGFNGNFENLLHC